MYSSSAASSGVGFPGSAVRNNTCCIRSRVNFSYATFSAGDSFATTFGDTPHYCESIGNESAIIFVAYAGVEEEPVTIPFKK